MFKNVSLKNLCMKDVKFIHIHDKILKSDTYNDQ